MPIKESTGYRLGELARRHLEATAQLLDKKPPEVLELAIIHFAADVRRQRHGEDVRFNLTVPPDDPKPPAKGQAAAHKRASRAA